MNNRIHIIIVACILLGARSPQKATTHVTATSHSLDGFKLVWLQEGEGCQNLANDTANNGGRSFTCNGITQSAWEQAISQGIVPKDSPINVKDAYSKDKKMFKQHAETIYKTNYTSPCQDLPPLTKAVCLPQSINFGVNAVSQRITQLNKSLPDRQQAQQLIDLAWQRYQAICANDPSQRPFCEGGWKTNIENQTKYINGTL